MFFKCFYSKILWLLTRIQLPKRIQKGRIRPSSQESGYFWKRRFFFSVLRLVFTSDWIGVGVVIESVKLYDLVKTAFWFFLFRLRLRRLRSSENWVFGVASWSGRTKPITERGNVHCNWFILPLLLPTQTIWFSLDYKRNVSDRVVSGVGRNGNVLIVLNPLTTPTPTPKPKLSLVKKTWIAACPSAMQLFNLACWGPVLARLS